MASSVSLSVPAVCGHACNSNEACTGGVCLKTNGTSCGGPSECVSNHCSDGVCCDQDCSGACSACNLSNLRGTCSPVASGNDPHHLCGLTPSPTCGTNGQCSSGACAYWKGNPCNGPTRDSCQDTTTLATFQCNGAGVCAAHKVDCTPYQCEAINGTGGGAGAVCASGPCVTSIMTGTCIDMNVCAPNCNCKQPGPDCTGSFCTCN